MMALARMGAESGTQSSQIGPACGDVEGTPERDGEESVPAKRATLALSIE